MNRHYYEPRHKGIVCVLALTIGIVGCAALTSALNQRPVANTTFTPKVYTVKSHQITRVITFNDYMGKALWNDPSVMRDGDQLIMYLTANVGGKWGTVLPFRGISKDGLKWHIDATKPLLNVGSKGTFDQDSVETPSIVYFKNQYHMYYTGIRRGALMKEMAIGHATSENGINWRKTSEQPILKPTGNPIKDWNGYHVAEPGAVVYNNQVYLYVHASGRRAGGGKPSNQSVIALAVSDDGHTFTPMQKVLVQGPRYPASSPEGYAGYSTPSALVVNDKIHLFYDVIATKPQWTQVALHHAVSNDGISFVEDDQPWLTRKQLPWTKTSIRAPSVIYDNDSFRVWFAGHNIDDLASAGIGYTTRQF